MAISEILQLVFTLLMGIGSGVVIAVLVETLRRRSRRMKELESTITEVQEDAPARASVRFTVEEALEREERDRRAAFIILTIDTEKRLREFASIFADFREPLPIYKLVNLLIERGILKRKWEESFRILWRIRNRVIHAETVSDREIELGSVLAASLQEDLTRKEIQRKPVLPKSRFEIKKAANGQFFFVLIAPNNEILAKSEMYTTKDACKNGIEMMKRSFPDAAIRDIED